MNKTLVGAVVFLVAGFGFLLYRQAELRNRLKEAQAKEQQLQVQLVEEKKDAERAKQQAAALQPRFIPATDNLVSGSVAVQPSSVSEVRITVDRERMRNARVFGKFTPSGGTGNDIEVLLLDEDNYTNWKNRHQARMIYSSGRTTVGKIDAELPGPGVYYLIFDNRFSMFAPKTVNADIKLRHEKLRIGS